MSNRFGAAVRLLAELQNRRSIRFSAAQDHSGGHKISPTYIGEGVLSRYRLDWIQLKPVVPVAQNYSWSGCQNPLAWLAVNALTSPRRRDPWG